MDEDQNRRRVLTGIGAAGAIAVAGCLGDDEDAADPSDDTDDGSGGGDDGDDFGPTEADADGTDGADDVDGMSDDGNGTDDLEQTLHQRYGYPSTSIDEDEPVESDHLVQLLMEPQEQGPPEFYFEPAGLAVETGDVVRFEFQSPDHAVAAFHEAFGRTHRCPQDAEPISSPMMAVGTYWLCAFEQPGVWDLYCPPHEMLGMGMRLVVNEASGPGAEPADPEAAGDGKRPPDEPLVATFNAEALDADSILGAGEVSWEEVREELTADEEDPE